MKLTMPKRNPQLKKNLSDASRHNSLLTNSNKGVLNTDSSDTGNENSQWWKNLSDDSVSLTNKLNSTSEVPDKNNEDCPDRILSQSESDDEEICPRKSLFAIQKQRSQKSRYSRAFNLNAEAIIESSVHSSEEQNFEIEEFKNQHEDDNKIREFPTSNLTKDSKKRRKTKTLFSKKLGKRKFSDAFKVTDVGPEDSEQTNKGKLVQDQDSTTENISVSNEPIDEKRKEALFKLNYKKKKFSDIFSKVTDKSVERTTKKEGELEKTGKQVHTSESSNHNKTVETSDMKEKVSGFKPNFKNTKYSKSFAQSESKVQENNESADEEINIEETHTQKDVSNVSNRSLNILKEKTNLHKIIEKTPQKEIHNKETDNTSKTNLLKSNSKIKKSIRNEKDYSESSDGEVFIEEINTQKEAAEASNRSINVTKKISSKRDTRSKKYSEAFLDPTTSKILHGNNDKNIENEVDETKLHSNHHVKDNQISRKEKESSDEENADDIRKHEEAVEQSINIAKETKKNLFIRDTKSRKFSQAFLNPSTSKLVEAEEQENDEHEAHERISSRQHAKENLFPLQNKNRQSTNIFEGDAENKENNPARTDLVKENSVREGQENLEKEMNTNTKYSQAFLELISMQKLVEEEHNVANNKHIEDNDVFVNKSSKETLENEKSDNDTKFSSIASVEISDAIKHPLFRPQARKSLYSVKSVTKNIVHSKIASDNEPQLNLEKSKTQKIRAKRFSLRSTSPTESLSHFFDESLISSTKLFINPNENADTGSEGSVKKKRGRPPKSVSIVHENSGNTSEIDIQKSKDNKNAESEVAVNSRNESEGSVKKKKGRPPKSVSVEHENYVDKSEIDIQKSKDNKDAINNKNFTPKRGRKSSKSLTDNHTIGKNEDTAKIFNSTSQRDRKPKLIAKDSKNLSNVSKNNMINDSDTELEELNKSSNSKRGRKPKSVSTVSEDRDNNEPEDEISKEDINMKTAELVKNKNDAPKQDRKFKSVTKVFEDSADNASENETLGDEVLDAVGIVENINSTSERGRKLKLITKDLEETKKNEHKNKNIEDKDSKSDDIIKNKNTPSKRGGKSKSITRLLKDQENYEFENEMIRDDDLESNEPVNYKNSTPKRLQKSKSVTRAAVNSHENVLTKNSESNVVKKKKRGRPPKLISTVSENIKNIDVENKVIEPEKSEKKENSTSNRMRKSSIRTDENYDNELEDKRNAESEELMRNEYSKSRNTSVSSSEIPLQGEPVNEIFATEEKYKEMDKQMQQKKIASKISNKSKTVSNVFQKQENSKTVDNNIMLEENTDIDSGETVKRQILPINNTEKSKSIRNIESHENSTSEDDNVPEKSCQFSAAMPEQSVIEKQQQSSKFCIDRKLETESISDNVTIHDSMSRARSSQVSKQNTNRNILVETWISERTNYVETENRHMTPFVKRIKTLDGWKPATESEDSEVRKLRKELLAKAVNKPHEKQNKPSPQVPDKKITDFYAKLKENEKLKPIPKNTDRKKISRPVCTARLINGKPYYSKKLYRGKCWCSPQLYKLLQNKIQNKYGDDTKNESEKLMKFIAQSVQLVIKSKKHLKEEIDNLKKELAKYGIISTTYDFFCFSLNYLPAEYQDLAIPTPASSVPCNKDEVWKPIL